MAVQNETRKAFHELLDLLREVDERWLGPEWMIHSSEDVSDGMRAAMHMLQGGLVSHFEDDPAHPFFRRIVSPTRKFTGDNADAIYYDAAVSGEHRYRVRGRMDGAVYVSLTVEAGAAAAALGGRTAGVINDTQFDLDPSGSFEIALGGPPQARNWIALPADATRITTRHYFEEERCAAADPARHLALGIEAIDPGPPPPRPSDASVAAGLRRVATFVRTRTLEMPPPGKRQQPDFVSTTPNQFPKPVKPGDLGLAAADAAYSMAPYVLGPDQALVVRARWPRCRCANVDLWNRHMQTYDYANRRVTLNRKQTRVEADGSFRVVIAHRDPGVPNWLDSEGRPFGMVFWRFMLPEGEIETPTAEVVPFDRVARKA
ncbi:MAG: DUF1214 domain-containing protein [Myxococcales bacterium]|nr:MAG: DUF1214 domain-containing protein [Myxococcales bacterium]